MNTPDRSREQRYVLSDVRHDQAGFESLVRLSAALSGTRFSYVKIDMSHVDWLDADMCAPLGAVLYRLGHQGNTVQLVHLQHKVEMILSKNDFLSHYGRVPVRDTYGTTIPYQRFDAKDDRFFASYIEAKFVRRMELPRMSSGLVKRFRESVFEIFSNAVIHSQSTSAFSVAGSSSQSGIGSIFQWPISASGSAETSGSIPAWTCRRIKPSSGPQVRRIQPNAALSPEDSGSSSFVNLSPSTRGVCKSSRMPDIGRWRRGLCRPRC